MSVYLHATSSRQPLLRLNSPWKAALKQGCPLRSSSYRNVMTSYCCGFLLSGWAGMFSDPCSNGDAEGATPWGGCLLLQSETPCFNGDFSGCQRGSRGLPAEAGAEAAPRRRRNSVGWLFSASNVGNHASIGISVGVRVEAGVFLLKQGPQAAPCRRSNSVGWHQSSGTTQKTQLGFQRKSQLK